ncbi:MAG TPA: hypothetical protein VFZ68_01640 [Acidimicrobiales bacterium]
MITTGSKWFYGLGLLSLVLAAAYGWTTGGDGVGPLTVGYKGGVGDHFGYGLLLAGGVVSILLGVASTALRDADAEVVARVAGTDTVPPVRPASPSFWPPVAAFGVALVAIGVVSSPVLVAFGLVALGIVLVEWAVQAWADNATGDPEVNRRIRNRVMNPIEFPAAGVLAVVVVAVALSRVFLALSAEATVWVATAVAAVVLLVGALVAARPRLSSNVVVALLMMAALAVIGLGVAGALAGEREFHHGGEEQETEAESEGAAPGDAPARASVGVGE